jgi:hypothetical protein
MGMVKLQGSALADALRAGQKAVCAAIREATAKVRENATEHRDRIFKGFVTLFDAYADPSTAQGEKVRYLVPMRSIAEDTGYSTAMVGHYRTIAENLDLQVQIGFKPGDVVHTPDGPMQTEGTPVLARVGDIYQQSDIGELSTTIRKTLNAKRGGRPTLSAEVLGARTAKGVLLKKENEVRDWLRGFVKTFGPKHEALESAVRKFAPKAGPKPEATTEQPRPIATS